MKKLINVILIFLLFTACTTKSENSEGVAEDQKIEQIDNSSFTTKYYGIGKVILEFENSITNKQEYLIEFFEQPKESNPTEILSLKWIEDNHGYVAAVGDEFLNIQDYYIDEPNYIAHFNCIERSNGFLKIVVNEESNETRWIKENNNLKLEPWSTYLKTAVCVTQTDFINNPARSEPIETSKILYDSEMCWEVIDFKGYWIKVKFSEIEMDMAIEKNREFVGWLKWRNDKELLIKYFLSI
ncbi:MAG: hypothetical protein ACI83W_001503 [Marinoscillum sp.]|jgi:hypothetical protein